MESTTAGEEMTFEWEERNESVPYGCHMIAGSLAGALEHMSMLPFDLVKTHEIAGNGKDNMITVMRNVYRKHGFMGYWKGSSAIFMGCLPAHAAYFTMYEHLKHKMNLDDGGVHTLLSGLTGAISTICHDTINTPADLVKQRQQLMLSKEATAFFVFKKVLREEGPLAFFRSLPITWVMNIPNAAVIVGVNDTLKVLYKPKDGHHFVSYLLCAGIAGATAAMVTIPMDVIKTKLQTQTTFQEVIGKKVSTSAYVVPNNPFVAVAGEGLVAKFRRYTTSFANPNYNKQVKYRNISSTIRTILAEEGIRGFFRGVVPRMITQAPSSAISWATYESLKNLLLRATQNKLH